MKIESDVVLANDKLVIALQNNLFLNRTFAWEEELENKVQALTQAQINAVMIKYLSLDKISIVKAGDFATAKASAKSERF